MTKISPTDYHAWFETSLGILCDRVEKESIFAIFKPKGIVLDIGCGTGNYTLELANQGIHAVGIDSSFDMAVFAKMKAERNGLKTNFVVGMAEALPFKGNTFDGVLGVTSLCFISNQELAVAEMRRTLKSGGDVVLGELNRLSYWALLRMIKSLFKKSSYRGARFSSLETLKRLLQKVGFTEVKWSSCLYFPPVNSSWVLKRYRFFERIGRILFPKGGAFVAVIGIKL